MRGAVPLVCHPSGKIGVLAFVHTDTAEEDVTIARLGGKQASCSPRGLLTSHCIVLCHYALDAAEAHTAAAAAALREPELRHGAHDGTRRHSGDGSMAEE